MIKNAVNNIAKRLGFVRVDELEKLRKSCESFAVSNLISKDSETSYSYDFSVFECNEKINICIIGSRSTVRSSKKNTVKAAPWVKGCTVYITD